MRSFKKIWIWGQIVSAAISVVYGIVNIIAGIICFFYQETVITIISSGLYQKAVSVISDIYPSLYFPMSNADTMQIFLVIESIVMGVFNLWLAWLIWKKIGKKFFKPHFT
ncbi:MAG: hypothetical protein COU29_02740 [Candidatus Magasanikbacteria bacterium CG10_big_fil_rev_8_21_14_0_10_36_32]|uniref:Uncharacterized protein n=1 Tax=Candidatus Magasanikbacteria bacterium CG10_big_fil_rev_8_21_14_0_10_36_32 TaxID=1974646 RepID=A0A2M6W7A1_9BACT|nr:MAG: hypothetical protein COU29_02740 [Candidatus Magasanikbacteria bacterium CG10_big_fil_rev_8_21_14_0_10_36_32]